MLIPLSNRPRENELARASAPERSAPFQIVEVMARTGHQLELRRRLQATQDHIHQMAIANPEIYVGAQTNHDRVHWFVEDNGIGVPAKYREHIFRPFKRLHSIESYAGTGLGLAIVRRSVMRLGGCCGVDSAPQGSRFWVELQQAGLSN